MSKPDPFGFRAAKRLMAEAQAAAMDRALGIDS